MYSALSTFNTTTRCPWARHRTHCPLLRVCVHGVCVHCCVCVHGVCVCVCSLLCVCVCSLLCVCSRCVCSPLCVCVCVHCCVCVCSLLCVCSRCVCSLLCVCVCVCVHCCVCVCVCVCSLLCVCVHGVCVHFGWVKCRARIPSMGHHTWLYVTTLSLNIADRRRIFRSYSRCVKSNL